VIRKILFGYSKKVTHLKKLNFKTFKNQACLDVDVGRLEDLQLGVQEAVVRNDDGKNRDLKMETKNIFVGLNLFSLDSCKREKKTFKHLQFVTGGLENEKKERVAKF
jgi:hypothetical protein